MLISEEMNEAMNQQIGSELHASNQYLNLASYFERDGLPELAGFFFRQSDEEREHALRFIEFLLDAGGEVAIPEIAAPPTDVKAAVDAVQRALDWELKVTRQINELMDLAIEQNDHTSQQFLRWFVDEQLEEVSTMEELLSVVRRAGDNLLMAEQYVVRHGDPHEGEAG